MRESYQTYFKREREIRHLAERSGVDRPRAKALSAQLTAHQSRAPLSHERRVRVLAQFEAQDPAAYAKLLEMRPDLRNAHAFVPRRLEDGRVCCSASYALCAACRAHFGLPPLAPPTATDRLNDWFAKYAK